MRMLADIRITPTDREAIVAAARLLGSHFPVVRVLLFGSKATGRDHPESDIDLLVLTSRRLSWRERDAITEALLDVEMEFEVVISTLVLDEEEWEYGPYHVLPIHDEVERHGVAA
jgi:predicted nucleotidyltransferase